MARPSSYNKKTGDTICHRLAEGESLREICRDEDMPAPSTVRRWVADIEEFRVQYTRAREDQIEHYADEILEIAHDGSNDWETRQTRNGEITVLNAEAVMRSRLRVDTLKWIMSKLAPKKYGDKIGVEVGPTDELTEFLGTLRKGE